METLLYKTAAGHRKIALLASILLLGSSFCLTTQGQDYSINWYKIAGGGGYSVSGTIYQPDAGRSLTGGSYSLTGGFWSLISEVQYAGTPNPNVTFSGHCVIISWPNTGAYTLEQNNNLASPAGWTASSYPITTANGTSSITISSPVGK